MAAHHQILRYAGDKGMLDTPRTTLVAAVVQDGCATWVHCGDSRLYLVRDGDIADAHPGPFLHGAPAARRRPAWTGSTATCCSPAWARPRKPVFDVTGPVTLQQGDKILLCSDGLWGTVGDDEIVQQTWRASRFPTRCPTWSRRPCAKAANAATT